MFSSLFGFSKNEDVVHKEKVDEFKKQESWKTSMNGIDWFDSMNELEWFPCVQRNVMLQVWIPMIKWEWIIVWIDVYSNMNKQRVL